MKTQPPYTPITLPRLPIDMWQTFLLGVAITTTVAVCWYIISLRRNVAKAKASGMPYYVAPCSPWFLPWQFTHKLWIPFIKKLPTAWWEPWLAPLTPNYSWIHRHDHFARYGDSFLIVSPGGIHLFAGGAEMIRQITLRREHFPKHTEVYGILDQFGTNILTSEGTAWRMHRKVTAPSFNERNSALIFRESIRQASGMLESWRRGTSSRPSSPSNPKLTLRTLERDTMRLALNIIGYVGFGLRMPWPHETMPADTDPLSAKYGSPKPPPGFQFSFVDAMAVLLENVMMLLLVPSWLIWLIPSKRRALQSRRDYEKFIDELLEEKMTEARNGQQVGEGMDLMGHLVRSSQIANAKAALGADAGLSREHITGNAFVMLVAGHETTANVVHFTLLQLAGSGATQRRLQRDLDELVGDTDPSTWDYETLVGPLMASMVGACMNETLRVMPPVIEMPKIVSPSQDQPVTLDGERYVLPAGTLISLCAAGVHMNPRHWPGRPSRVRPGHDDVRDYVPERWFRSSDSKRRDGEEDEGGHDGETGEDYGGFAGRDTSAQLFRPERGSYLPFSDGARACLGRRVAQVEVVVALAVLLREYSLELAVDEWATDGEVERMDREQRAKLFARARARRDETIAQATFMLTLKLRGKHVPVRLVKRGEERFVNWMDDA